MTLLPVLASAFRLSALLTPTSKHSATRAVHSPLLIAANWVRSALTYAFALYVWIAAPTFGAATPACNARTRLIFFGASLPALGSGRYMSLAGWGLFSALFVYRALRGRTTILCAVQALGGGVKGQRLLTPKRDPKNEVHRETVRRKNFATGEETSTYVRVDLFLCFACVFAQPVRVGVGYSAPARYSMTLYRGWRARSSIGRRQDRIGGTNYTGRPYSSHL